MTTIPNENSFSYCEGKLEDIYDIKNELGRGQFAVVKKCVHKGNGNEVAAKFIKVKRAKASRNGLSRELIEREASILLSLNHEKVIKCFDIFNLGTEVVLVLELLSGGELFDKICELEYLTEVDACCYLKQVLLGIEHLHNSSIVHLDIKPENIVLRTSDSTDIKLVDFGLAQKIIPGEDLREMMGTPEFVAPEVINYEKIGFYTDMWAIGVLTYILLSGCSPFLGDDNQETYSNIIKVDYHFDEEYFDQISTDAKEFVTKLLVLKPEKRSNVSECLAHPWVINMSTPRNRQDSTIIVTARFKAYVAKRRWQQSFQKLNAITRFSKFLKKGATLPACDEEDISPVISPCPSPVPTDEQFNGYEKQSVKEEISASNDMKLDASVETIESNTLETKALEKNCTLKNISEKDDHCTLEEKLNLQAGDGNDEDSSDKRKVMSDIKVCLNDKEMDAGHSKTKRVENVDPVENLLSAQSQGKTSIPQRKYSREVPVHYTQLLRQATVDEREHKEYVKIGGNPEQIEVIEAVQPTTNAIDVPANEEHEVDKTSRDPALIDTENIKGFDIRDTKISRVTSRKKAVFVDHKSMLLSDDANKKPTRSVSLEEQRRSFIRGELLGTVSHRSKSIDSTLLSVKEEQVLNVSLSVDENLDDAFASKPVIEISSQPTPTKSNSDIIVKSEITIDIGSNGSVLKSLDENRNIPASNDVINKQEPLVAISKSQNSAIVSQIPENTNKPKKKIEIWQKTRQKTPPKNLPRTPSKNPPKNPAKDHAMV